MVVWCHLLVLKKDLNLVNIVIQMINISEQSEGILNKTPPSDDTEEQEAPMKRKIINPSGVLQSQHLMLIGLLVFTSMILVWNQSTAIFKHQKNLRMYFNLNLLGLDNNGIYQNSDNQDEQYNQFFTYDDIRDLIKGVVNVTNSYAEDGTVHFQLDGQEPIITIQPVYTNDSVGLIEFYSVDEAMTFFGEFQDDSPRDFLLSVQRFYMTSRLGDSKFADNYQIYCQFILHHNLMVDGDFSYQYENIGDHIVIKVKGIRIFQQVIAGILLFMFIVRLVETRRDIKLAKDDFQKNLKVKYRNWYTFLIVLNVVAMISDTYTPFCAWLQVIPVFEFPQDEDEREMYSFNKNVRFALPLIMKIWIPLLISLHGFVFLSMLVYADSDASYFGDYFNAFFDYFYEIFQCGTYQIYTEMQQYGYIYDILYTFLYFYVFMTGNSLFPAFFVTLIQLKLNQRDVKRFTVNLAKNAICPNCHSQNRHEIGDKILNIEVTSPKLSPLVKQKRLTHSPKPSINTVKSDKKKNGSQSSEMSLFIQHSKEEQKQIRNNGNLTQQFVSHSKKVSQLLRKIKKCTEGQKDEKQLQIALKAIDNFYKY